METQKMMTLSEVAHRSTIYRLLKHRELPAFKAGSDWRFNRDDIDQWRMGRVEPAKTE
jgi:excisionase family DNA binding protein